MTGTPSEITTTGTGLETALGEDSTTLIGIEDVITTLTVDWTSADERVGIIIWVVATMDVMTAIDSVAEVPFATGSTHY